MTIETVPMNPFSADVIAAGKPLTYQSLDLLASPECHGIMDTLPLTSREYTSLVDGYVLALEEVAPDLKSNGLSRHTGELLFKHLSGMSAQLTRESLRTAGDSVYYGIGRDVLGPIAATFVHEVLSEVHAGSVVFPARDATPLYVAAQALVETTPDAYAVTKTDLKNPMFNRKLWGIDDEQDAENGIVPITDAMVQKLLSQIGFGGNNPVTFVEIGCWGSMVDQMQRSMPGASYQVYFFFTHLPEYIYGFTNQYGAGMSASMLETIADTWEAFPKAFKRGTKLVDTGGSVDVLMDGKHIADPFLPSWSAAALRGVRDAAHLAAASGIFADPVSEIARLAGLSDKAKSGIFTGVLPGHTETWSEGPAWKAGWRWGQIAPLGK